MSSLTRLVVAPGAERRLEEAARWLGGHQRAGELTIVASTLDAGGEIARRIARQGGGLFGWHRTTIGKLAATIAGPALADAGRAPAGRLSLDALAARVVFSLASQGEAALGKFAPVADRPGLARALARTVAELRMFGVAPADLEKGGATDLARLLAAYERELEHAALTDRAGVLDMATVRLRGGGVTVPAIDRPLLLLDVSVSTARERDLCAALASRATAVLATVIAGDEASRQNLEVALGVPCERLESRTATDAEGRLERAQRGLFVERIEASQPGGVSSSPARSRVSTEAEGGGRAGVEVMSAPGESREVVEIARRIHREAETGVPFDRIAVLLRSPGQYRAHLDEAFRRAGIPVFFDKGTRRPDPAGRAMLALLACAAEGLSARRFAEYLSLAQVPDATEGGTPPPSPPADLRFVPPDEELLPMGLGEEIEPAPTSAELEATALADPDKLPVALGTLRTPGKWERLLAEAAVIGGMERWRRRLDRLRAELLLDLDALEDPSGPVRERIQKDLDALGALTSFALPLLEVLATLPARAMWGEWLDALGALAPRALRSPDRVLAVLAELAPMAEVGPIDLGEVRHVLHERLSDLVTPPRKRRQGAVHVGPIETARGLSFDVVFVPGLAERMFPQKVGEDPLLLDDARERAGLPTNAQRVAAERLMLHVAVGAPRRTLVLSYPRVDMDQLRPRVPSFYGLEVLRAADGRLPGWTELATVAEAASVEAASRIGWPAPARPELAIDDAEHDLSLLATVLDRPEAEVVGTARYLIGANVHLARALRFRARRWNVHKWKNADGLVEPCPEARAALEKHLLDARSYSATALQHFAACPYRFYLSAICKLSPREVPEAADDVPPLERGTMVHEIQFQLLTRLRDERLLPVRKETYVAAQERLDAITTSVADELRDRLAPSIERVYEDAVALVRADLREWLRRAVADTGDWTPEMFELSFGLPDRRPEDPTSRDEPVPLDCGIALRGSIDLVERSRYDVLRATDHKTGKARARRGTLIGGGETLQPVLYALALEKLFPGQRVGAGRLYYCTAAGGFAEVEIPLDDEARARAQDVADVVGGALRDGFLPAAPKRGACAWCDYRPVCGPYEEQRTSRKSTVELAALTRLRETP